MSSFNAIHPDYVDTGVRFLLHSRLDYLTANFIDTLGINSSDRKAQSFTYYCTIVFNSYCFSWFKWEEFYAMIGKR